MTFPCSLLNFVLWVVVPQPPFQLRSTHTKKTRYLPNLTIPCPNSRPKERQLPNSGCSWETNNRNSSFRCGKTRHRWMSRTSSVRSPPGFSFQSAGCMRKEPVSITAFWILAGPPFCLGPQGPQHDKIIRHSLPEQLGEKM